MNDINGVWFDRGAYHLTYRAYPCATHWDTMHWGHAVSRNLLHWTQKEPALTPGDNTVGMAYSGSAVIDRDNAAGFGAGACLLFYTDTLFAALGADRRFCGGQILGMSGYVFPASGRRFCRPVLDFAERDDPLLYRRNFRIRGLP